MFLILVFHPVVNLLHFEVYLIDIDLCDRRRFRRKQAILLCERMGYMMWMLIHLLISSLKISTSKCQRFVVPKNITQHIMLRFVVPKVSINRLCSINSSLVLILECMVYVWMLIVFALYVNNYLSQDYSL